MVAVWTPVPEMSTSADPASSAWSRSSPLRPVRTTTWSGSAVRTSSVAGSHCGLRSRTMPAYLSTDVIMYGPEETGSRPYSGAVGVGGDRHRAARGQRQHVGELRGRTAQGEDDRRVVGGGDRRQAQPTVGLVLVRPGVGVARVVQEVDDVRGPADDDVGGERALDAVLDVAGGDRGAVLEADPALQREGPGAAVLRHGAGVGGEVGHQLAGVPGLLS